MTTVQVTGKDGITKNRNITELTVSAGGAAHVHLDAGLKVRVDEGATYTYIGFAEPGTATSEAKWRVKRIVNSSGDTDYADGDVEFDNIYDNRAALSYS